MSLEVQHLSDVVEGETYIVSLCLSMQHHGSRREEVRGRLGVIKGLLEMMTHAAPAGAPEKALRAATAARREVLQEEESLVLLDELEVASAAPTRGAVQEKIRRLNHDADQAVDHARKVMLRLELWRELVERHQAGWGGEDELLAALESPLSVDVVDALWPRQKYARRRSPEMSSATQAIWEITVGGEKGPILMSGMWKMSVKRKNPDL